MRKHFYNDILIVAVICAIAILFFNSCRAKKEILETRIESRDSVCNTKESQNIVLMHEDSICATDQLTFDHIDTGRVCIVRFNDIVTRDTSGTVTMDKSITVYKKHNAGHTTMDRTEASCSVSSDSSSASIDSVATTEQHVDSIDQAQQKTERKWDTWHVFWFWIVIVLCLSAGIVESNRKR